MATSSKLTQIMAILSRAMPKADPLDMERMASAIYQVMSARFRIFHNVSHILETADDLDPVYASAALFHDVVYFQVDKRIHPLLIPFLEEFSVDETSRCVLPKLESESCLKMVGQVFGFKSGQILNPMSGLNEFLSAVAAARILCVHMSEWEVIQVVAGLEATIPFRPNTFDALRERMGEVVSDRKLKIAKAELDRCVRSCVALSNNDVSGFYNKKFGIFISGTWNLILESNPIFRNPLYTIGEYAKALQKIRSFFGGMKYENVVHEWGGYPKPAELAKMHDLVRTNLAHALLYIDLKLVAIAVLEALAALTGGDAPYLLFTGDAVDKDGSAAVEKFFPKKLRQQDRSQMRDIVYETLKSGRTERASFDFKHSPFAAYLFEAMPIADINEAILLAREFHDGTLEAKKFLRFFRPEVLKPIIEGISEVSWSRAKALKKVKL